MYVCMDCACTIETCSKYKARKHVRMWTCMVLRRTSSLTYLQLLFTHIIIPQKLDGR